MLEEIIVQAGLESSEDYKRVSDLLKAVVDGINQYWRHDIFLPEAECGVKFREIDRKMEELLSMQDQLRTKDEINRYYRANMKHILSYFMEMTAYYNTFKIIPVKVLSL